MSNNLQENAVELFGKGLAPVEIAKDLAVTPAWVRTLLARAGVRPRRAQTPASGTCSVEGCQRPVVCRDLCRACYKRALRKSGPPGPIPQPCDLGCGTMARGGHVRCSVCRARTTEAKATKAAAAARARKSEALRRAGGRQ